MREQIYDGKVIKLTLLDGRWEVVEHPGSVGVLVARGREVLGVTQARPATGRVSWEVPAGLIDQGESPEQAAARELAEEAQLGGRLELVARFHTSPGFTSEETFLYELHGAVPAEGGPDEDEPLELEWRDAFEVWEEALAGRLVTSSVTAVALRLVMERTSQPAAPEGARRDG